MILGDPMKWFTKLVVAMSAAALAMAAPGIAAPAQAIVGGTAVPPGDTAMLHRSMAGLVDVSSGQVFCGGSLISDAYVVTAATCLKGRALAGTAVLLGDLDTATGTDSPYAALYTSGSWALHPSFEASSAHNNIAVIRLSKKVELNAGVAPILVDTNTKADAHASRNATALGWGSSSFGGPRTTKLRKVPLRVIPAGQCNSYYGNVDGNIQMCTYTVGKGPCQYDTGGPLTETLNGRPNLIGIISNGSGCAASYPDVYTRVAAYRTWIASIVGPLPTT
jgi:secreted trypsin-like serine protease